MTSFSMQVTVSKDDTVILDGAGDKKSIEERAEQVHAIYYLYCADLNCFFLVLIVYGCCRLDQQLRIALQITIRKSSKSGWQSSLEVLLF